MICRLDWEISRGIVCLDPTPVCPDQRQRTVTLKNQGWQSGSVIPNESQEGRYRQKKGTRSMKTVHFEQNAMNTPRNNSQGLSPFCYKDQTKNPVVQGWDENERLTREASLISCYFLPNTGIDLESRSNNEDAGTQRLSSDSSVTLHLTGVQMVSQRRMHVCQWLVCSRRKNAVRLVKAPLQSSTNPIAAGSQTIIRLRANEPSS